MAEPPIFDKLRSVVIHEGIAKRLSQQLKYHDRTDLAPLMARWMVRASDGMLADCDYIMAVPLHRWRLLSRRFNQSAELARQISSATGKPFVPAALTRRKATRQQVGLTALGRQENMRGAFKITAGYEQNVAGKRVLLIDDVYTTGATVSALARVLKRGGAEKVYVLTFAMALANPI
jgi:ComF family protein